MMEILFSTHSQRVMVEMEFASKENLTNQVQLSDLGISISTFRFRDFKFCFSRYAYIFNDVYYDTWLVNMLNVCDRQVANHPSFLISELIPF